MKKPEQSTKWLAQIHELLAKVDGPPDPETAADEAQKPKWAWELDRIAVESAWAALPMNRAWSEAKRTGCLVGREFVMRRWMMEQTRAGANPDLKALFRDGAHQLEVEMGPGIADEVMEQLRTLEVDDSGRNIRLASILTLAFQASVKECAEFFDGFVMPIRKRAENGEVWKSVCLRVWIHSVLQNNWPEVPHLRPLRVLCDFVLARIPPRMSRRIRNDDVLTGQFRENLRKLCNSVGLPTGTVGRPRKNSA
ncbi:MAG: hypothetical protein WDN28_21420 [Chthoniobacter sp.]